LKKTILITAAVILIANYSNAQVGDTDFRDEVRFGVKIGANYSNVYDAEGEEFNADPKFGLATGIFLSIPIGKHIGIQPEVLFSQRGFKAEGSLLGSPYVITRTTHYLDVPLLFSIKPIEYVSILAGPQYSFLISQTNKFENALTSIEQEEEFDNENIRKNTFCFTGGLDFNLNHFVIGGRVGWDLFKNNGDGSTTTPRYKNLWYQLTLGYVI
jgi:hypothetical protein